MAQRIGCNMKNEAMFSRKFKLNHDTDSLETALGISDERGSFVRDVVLDSVRKSSRMSESLEVLLNNDKLSDTEMILAIFILDKVRTMVEVKSMFMDILGHMKGKEDENT